MVEGKERGSWLTILVTCPDIQTCKMWGYFPMLPQSFTQVPVIALTALNSNFICSDSYMSYSRVEVCLCLPSIEHKVSLVL